MKIDFTQELRDLFGNRIPNVVQEGGGDFLTLQLVCTTALLNAHPDDQGKLGNAARAWKLAKDIMANPANAEIAVADAAWIAERIPNLFAPAVSGPAYDMLNGGVDLPEATQAKPPGRVPLR